MDALYLDYAAGALSEPARLLVDTHFAMRPERRLEAAVWEVAGAAFFEADAEAVDQDALNRVLARLDAEGEPLWTPGPSDVPGPLGTVLGRPLHALHWGAAAPGALEYVMPRWPQARLIRMIAAQSAEWTLGQELALVLDGEVETADGAHGPGDLLVIDRSVRPPEPRSDRPVYFSVQESGYTPRDVRSIVAASDLKTWAWRRRS